MNNGLTKILLINPRRLFALAALLVALLPGIPYARAADTDWLYTARVPLESSGAGAREQAYADALSQVLLRMTGPANALVPEQLREWFPNPARYVMQYRPGEENTLWVTLDGGALENVLRQAGYTVWGSDRPLTLVWLAVDWGQGEREIVASDDSDRSIAEAGSVDRNRLLRERVQEVAMERGVPVAFPLLDAQELQSVSFSDIWGGFSDGLLEASRRYGADSVLVGRLRPESAQRNRWSWFLADERREWTGEPEEAMTLLADALAEQFAVAGNASLEAINLVVSGISSVAAYGAVHSYIQNLSIVESLAIDTVSGDRISYAVKARGGRERLERALNLSRVLEVDDSFDRPVAADAFTTPAALEYRYRP